MLAIVPQVRCRTQTYPDFCLRGLMNVTNTEIQIATTEELSLKKKKYKKSDTPLQTFNWNFARVGR